MRKIYKPKNLIETMPKEIISINDVGSHPIRWKILNLCKSKKMKMTDLQRAIGIEMTRGKLRHHLNVLEEFELIEPMERAETEHGRPTYIKTNVAKIKQLQKDHEEIAEKKAIEHLEKHGKDMSKVLQLTIKPIERKELIDKIVNDKSLPDYASMYVSSLWTQGLTKETIEITKEGMDFLKRYTDDKPTNEQQKPT